VGFAAITLCVASQRVLPKISVYFVTTQSGNFWIYTLVYIPEISADNFMNSEAIATEISR
jgi:hypothetical protein